MSGVVIGGLHELGLDYVQGWDSGNFADQIDADGDRTRTVTLVAYALKEDERATINAMPTHPAPLRTPAGQQANGAPANMLDWGSDYELTDIRAAYISPQICRIAVDYQATNPTAGATAIQGAGSSEGAYIGGMNYAGNVYREVAESGFEQEERVYIADSMGWNRTKEVRAIYGCQKKDLITAAPAIPVSPASLETNDGAGGTINWQGGYTLESLRSEIKSPSIALITALYRRTIPEAIAAPPADMEISCSDGVCRIKWKGITMETWDSGVTTPDTGLDITIDTEDRLKLTCNNVEMETFECSAADTVNYDLDWVVTSNRAQLAYRGAVWKDYSV